MPNKIKLAELRCGMTKEFAITCKTGVNRIV